MLNAAAEFKDFKMFNDALRVLTDVYPISLAQREDPCAAHRILMDPAINADIFFAFQRWGIYAGLPSVYYNLSQSHSAVSDIH